MKKLYLVLIFVSLSVTMALAQDPQFSQFYQAPLYLNPGFTGVTQQQRAVVNNRIQWPNLPYAFTTYAFSYDIFVDELRSGFGLLVTTDKMGSSGLEEPPRPVFCTAIRSSFLKSLFFRPGLSFGYGTNGLDRTKLVFGDQIQYAVSPGQTINPNFPRLGNAAVF